MAKTSGLFGSGNGIEELIMLKELGVLDGDQNNDQITKMMMFMSLQNNQWQDDIRSYTKESKKGGGGGSSKKSSGQDGNLFSMLQSFNSIQMQNVFGQVEQSLIGIERGIDLSQIAAGYSLTNWGNVPTNDAKLVKAIINSIGYLAYLVRQESTLERTESFYAMLEAFEGTKTWGNSANTSAVLPLVLLSNGGSLFSAGTLPPFTAPFSS